MSDSSIRAILGMDTSDWSKNAKEAGADSKRLKEDVANLKAGIASLEQGFKTAGSATTEGKKQLKEYRSELSGLESDLRKAEARVKAFNAVQAVPRAPQPPAPNPPGGGGGHGGHGGGNMGRAELGHVGRSFVDSLSAGQSPVNAAAMETPRLIQAFGGGLGMIAGIGAVVGIVKQLNDARNEAKELKKALDALGAPMPAAGKASVEEINDRLKQTLETSQKLEAAKSGFWHVLAGALGNRLKNPMGNIVEAVAAQGDTDDANARGAEGEKDRLTHSLAMSQKVDIDLDKRSANGDDSAAFDRIRKKGAEERQGIEERISKGELSRDTELVANSHAREKLEIEIEQRRQDAAKNTLALESQLLQIKRTGADVEVKSAEARLSAARQALFNGPREGIEHAGNFGKVQEAEEAYRIAQRTRDEHRDDLDIQEAVALVVKNSDARHLVALGMEEQKLHARLASPEYGDDEKRTMSAHLVDVQNEQHEAMRSYMGKANQAWLAQQSASYGTGPAGQLQGIRDRKMVLGMETDANTAGTREDGSPVYKNGFLGAQQTAEAANLKRQEDAILFSEQQQLEAAKARTTQMQDEERGLTGQAKIEGIRAGYQQQIAQAIHDQKNDLADQLKTQQGIAVAEAKLQEFLKTPAQKAQEQRDATKRQHDLLRMNDGGRTHDADRHGGTARDKGWSGGPDNAGGTAAAESEDNAPSLPGRTDWTTPLPDLTVGAHKLGLDSIPGFSTDNPFDAASLFNLGSRAPAMDANDGNAGGGKSLLDVSGLQPMFDKLSQDIINACTG